MNIQDSADVDPSAAIGEGTRVWHLAQIRERATLGPNCIVGRGAYVDAGVQVGANSKIQNHALVYAPARLGDGVFIGPAAVLTNDIYPRAVDPAGQVKDASGWEAAGVVVGEGAAIGARSVVRAGVTIGRWALIGAGTVVVKDVPEFALVVGNPGHQIGWVGHAGRRLIGTPDDLTCPVTDRHYHVVDGALEER